MNRTQALSFARNHWLVSLVVFAVSAVGTYYVFFRSDVDTATSGAVTRTAQAEKSDLRVVVAGSGQVEADSQVDLKPVVAGDAIVVTTVAVKNDQEVKKGQVIAVLDNEDARRDVGRAELDLRQAEIKEKQTDSLYPKLESDDMRQRQLANVSVAQSIIALEKVRDKLADYTIRAPFDGIVTGLSVESGDTISQTAALASVITKKLHVLIALNEVDAARVREGNEAMVSFVALPDVTVNGRVVKLDTIGTVTQNVVSYGAEIELAEQPAGLKPGMSAMADIVVAEKIDVLTVPNAALSNEKGKAVVMIRRDGTADSEKQAVITGLSNETVTEIVSGLAEGSIVELPGISQATTANAASGSQGSILNLFRGSNSGSRSSGLPR